MLQSRRKCVLRLAGASVISLAGGMRPVRAQATTFLDVGSEADRYARVLQITGYEPLYPWTLRPLSPAERDRTAPADTGHPWAGWLNRLTREGHAGSLRWALLPMQARAFYNSEFPFGFNDGAVWQGRGVTMAVQGGVAARWGHVSLQLEPALFQAQNSAFPLTPTGFARGSIYANPFWPNAIDLPQRFGPRAYGRFDPGQSTIRVDAGPFAAGFSTANQFWGPAIDNPIILGDNAAGFPRGFIGTSHPANLWFGTVHGQIMYGRLEESPYAPPNSYGASRLMSGAVGSFSPRGVPGLELGATRFFHTPWPKHGLRWSDLRRPFEGILKEQLATASDPTGNDPSDDQLASVFFRWAFPRSGFEVYGEYGREDHSVNTRDLMGNLDHDAAYVLGLQRVWRRSASRWYVFRAEEMDSRISHLSQALMQAPWYIHSPTNQGHTELGQVLGGPDVFGGGATVFQADRYDPSGRWTARIARGMRAEPFNDFSYVHPDSADVTQTIGIERLLRLRRFDITLGATQVWDINRDYSGNKSNLNLQAALLARW